MFGLLLPLALFYVANGYYETCRNMTNKACQEYALKEYNYTASHIVSMKYLHALILEERIACKLEGECPIPEKSILKERVPCTNGFAAGYPCSNVSLLAFVSLSDLGSGGNADGNDIWGYTNSEGEMFAITGQTDGASIVDITTPTEPIVLCFIPARVSTNTVWRDMKVIGSYAYIVADRSGQGLQWINLDTAIAKCRASSDRPLRLAEGTDFGWTNGPYGSSSNTHNIVANPAANTVYLVGSSSTCSGGLVAVDTSDVPSGATPSFAGCYASDGYSHDAECVIYNGDDPVYQGRNICFGYNENSITIVDMTNPSSPTQISRLTYTGSAYTHQGWITDDHNWLLMNDELDEQRGNVGSQTTYVIDLRQGLANPQLYRWASGISSIDHNLYIRGSYAYESNYEAGLRILNIDNIASVINQNRLSEVGYFDTYPSRTATAFNGAWSVYPFFGTGTNPEVVVIQDINRGLFIVDPTAAFDVDVATK